MERERRRPRRASMGVIRLDRQSKKEEEERGEAEGCKKGEQESQRQEAGRQDGGSKKSDLPF